MNEFIRLQQAIKVGIAEIIALLVINFLHLENGFFTAIGVFIIMTNYYQQVWLKGFQRVMGPFIFWLIASFAVTVFHFWISYVVVMGALIFLGGYIFGAGVFPYAALLGCVIGGVVMMTGYQDPSLGIETGKQYVENTFWAILIAWIVTALIWPIRYNKALKPKIVSLLKAMSSEVVTLKMFVTLKDISSLEGLLNLCRNDFSSDQAYFTYQHFLLMLKELIIKQSTLNIRLLLVKKLTIYPLFAAELIRLLLLIKKEYEEFAQALENKVAYVPNNHEWKIRLDQLHKHMVLAREKKVFQEYKIDQVLNLFSVTQHVRQLFLSFKEISKAYINTLNPSSEEAVFFMPKEKKPTLWPVNMDACKTGFKVMLCFLLLFFVEVKFGLAAGMPAIITCIVLISKPNIGRAALAIKLRIAGVMIGGIAGFIGLILVAQSQQFLVLAIYLFLGLTFAAYIAYGQENIAYGGIQAGVMFPMILLTTNKAPNSLSIATQRLEGVILGFIVGILVLYFIWPAHPVAQLKKKVISISDRIALRLRSLKDENPAARQVSLQEIEKALQSHGSLLFDAQYVFGDSLRDSNRWVSFFSTLNDLYNELYLLISTIEDQTNNAFLSRVFSEFTVILSMLADSLSSMSEEFSQGKTLAISMQATQEKFLAIIQNIREQKITKDYTNEQVENYATFYSTLNHLLHTTKKMSHQIEGLIE